MDNKEIKFIKKMYDKLNYFDQYGASVILFVIITIILILSISYCYAKIHSQPIIDDWANQRCKPNIIPFAGFITHPKDSNAIEYTSQNFNYCIQNILSSITGMSVEPITFVVNMYKKMMDSVKEEINRIRGMFDKVRTMFQEISEEIMGRIMNFTIPLIEMVVSFKDLLSKVQGAMTGGLFTLLGSYYTLKALMGAIAEFIIIILITLAALIVVLWIVPFTWGTAISMTAIFIAISIPMAIILAFMLEVLHVQTNLKIPTLKCFDENTMILMNDGNKKKISEINPGDILYENNEVTSCIKVETKGSILYELDNIIVSDSHIVNFNNNWIPIFKHPDAKIYNNYSKPFLYCLNTSNKIIKINNHIFSDWDEIFNKDIEKLKNNKILKIKKNSDIHFLMESGFNENTKIKLKNGSVKNIKEVSIGDILINNELVYGVVMINGKTIKHQYKYDLGENIIVEGGPNINWMENNLKNNYSLLHKNKISITNNDILYHLLTIQKTFYIENIQFYDYNAAIDLFLEKK